MPSDLFQKLTEEQQAHLWVTSLSCKVYLGDSVPTTADIHVDYDEDWQALSFSYKGIIICRLGRDSSAHNAVLWTVARASGERAGSVIVSKCTTPLAAAAYAIQECMLQSIKDGLSKCTNRLETIANYLKSAEKGV